MLTQKKIVAVTTVLHHYIREHSSADVDFANCDQDLDFVPTILDIYKNYAVLYHASDDSTSEASFLTMDGFHGSVATSLSVV
jgi:hypothetical protein